MKSTNVIAFPGIKEPEFDGGDSDPPITIHITLNFGDDGDVEPEEWDEVEPALDEPPEPKASRFGDILLGGILGWMLGG